MIDEDSFHEVVMQIMKQGYSEAEALKFAFLIGDTPMTDEQGRLVVMDGDMVLARLEPLPNSED
jgi:hypothetical protein